MMYLILRMAVSNGNRERKLDANRVITEKNHATIEFWNKQLQSEIRDKETSRCPRRATADIQRGGQA